MTKLNDIQSQFPIGANVIVLSENKIGKVIGYTALPEISIQVNVPNWATKYFKPDNLILSHISDSAISEYICEVTLADSDISNIIGNGKPISKGRKIGVFMRGDKDEYEIIAINAYEYISTSSNNLICELSIIPSDGLNSDCFTFEFIHQEKTYEVKNSKAILKHNQ